MIVLSDREGKNWGVYVYHSGTERVLYTTMVDYPEEFPKEIVISSFDGDFRLMVGTDGALHTYPINRRLV